MSSLIDKSSDAKIGERIRQVRKENGLSQKSFADVLNCEQYKISRLEKGLGVRDLDWLRFISVAFDVPLDYLIFGVALKEDTKMAKTDKKGTVFLGASQEDDCVFRGAMENFAGDGLTVIDEEGTRLSWDLLYEKGDEIRVLDKTELDELFAIFKKRGYVSSISFLSSIKDSESPEVEARRMAKEILEFRAGEEKELYWSEAEQNLLAFVLLYMVENEDKSCGFHKVIWALRSDLNNGGEEELREAIESSMTPELRSVYDALRNDRNTNAVAVLVEEKLRDANLMW